MCLYERSCGFKETEEFNFQDDRDIAATNFNFKMAEYDTTTLAKFIKHNIEVMLPYMDGPNSHHFVI